ncbi:MAG: hypothetical protein GF355_14225 [Candidatus Eisenbacteria bacterium]|nr:hypothetical protein [Candidatus Eisenbacteria bacterium]
MRNHAVRYGVAAILLCLIPAAGQGLEPYSQTFEDLIQSDPDALANDGWLVYGNVFTPDSTFLYGYGPFPAPNHELGFCQIALGEGGDEQGEQVLVVFNDYQSEEHNNGNLVESNVFQEQTITADDVGSLWSFAFQAKRGNIEGISTALAFIKTLDPNNGYALTNFITVDMTSISFTWRGYALAITIDESLEGQILQIGFANTTTNYVSSGVFYDNLVFEPTDPAGLPEHPAIAGLALGRNSPNPFHNTTQIGFSLDRPGSIDLSVLDVTGRRIATLYRGELGAGDHRVAWNGRTSSGVPAAGGHYWYVLHTASGTLTGRMVLTD